MEDQTETIWVPDGARCKISVGNTTNFETEWKSEPVWHVNYTVFHGKGRSNEIVSGESGKERTIAFHRIPDCYFDKLGDFVNLTSAYAANTSSTKSLQWLVLDNEKSGHSQCDDQFLLERAALAALNFAAPSQNTQHTIDGLWINSQQQCGWENIVCTDSGFVKSLLVKELSLVGTISTAIGKLVELERLEYDNNGLTGTIPSEIGLLTKLSGLQIDGNLLIGTIPTELGNLIDLMELDLDKNELFGSIPTEIGRMVNLIELDLKKNQLLGTIPTEVGRLLNLKTLQSGNNVMTGSLPTELGALINLTDLELNNNSITGRLPTQLGKLTQLNTFDLGYNDLTGSIPTEIGFMESLTLISLRGNSLRGTIPSEIGLLTTLTEIQLEGNDFTGTVPVEVASMERLEVLTFGGSLTGDIPGNIKTLVPCVLCSGTSYKLKHNRDNVPYSSSGARDVDCDMLLEEQQDDEKPFSNNDCEVLKDACVDCTVPDNLFAAYGDAYDKNNDQ